MTKSITTLLLIFILISTATAEGFCQGNKQKKLNDILLHLDSLPRFERGEIARDAVKQYPKVARLYYYIGADLRYDNDSAAYFFNKAIALGMDSPQVHMERAEKMLNVFGTYYSRAYHQLMLLSYRYSRLTLGDVKTKLDSFKLQGIDTSKIHFSWVRRFKIAEGKYNLAYNGDHGINKFIGDHIDDKGEFVHFLVPVIKYEVAVIRNNYYNSLHPKLHNEIYKLQQLKKKDWHTHELLAELYILLNNDEKALTHYGKAVALLERPNVPLNTYFRVVEKYEKLLIRKGKMKEYVAFAESLPDSALIYFDYYLYKAEVKFREGEPEEALFYLKATQEDYDDAVHAILIPVLLELNRTEELKKWLIGSFFPSAMNDDQDKLSELMKISSLPSSQEAARLHLQVIENLNNYEFASRFTGELKAYPGVLNPLSKDCVGRFIQYATTYPKDTVMREKAAHYALMQGDIVQAVALIKSSSYSTSYFASVYLRLGMYEEAKHLIDKIKSEQRSDDYLEMVAGAYHYLQGNYIKAENLWFNYLMPDLLKLEVYNDQYQARLAVKALPYFILQLITPDYNIFDKSKGQIDNAIQDLNSNLSERNQGMWLKLLVAKSFRVELSGVAPQYFYERDQALIEYLYD